MANRFELELNIADELVRLAEVEAVSSVLEAKLYEDAARLTSQVRKFIAGIKGPLDAEAVADRINEVFGSAMDEFFNAAANAAASATQGIAEAESTLTYLESIGGSVSETKFIYISVMSERTCDVCAAKHGTIGTLDEFLASGYFPPIEHGPHGAYGAPCYCTLQPVDVVGSQVEPVILRNRT